MLSGLSLDNEILESVSGSFSYGTRLDISFQFECGTASKTHFFGLKEILSDDERIEAGVSLLLQNASISESSQKIELTFSKQPFQFGSESKVDLVRCIVVNGPRLYFKKNNLCVDEGAFQLEYNEFVSVHAIRLSGMELAREMIATGYIEIRRQDGNTFDAAQAIDHSFKMARFFELVRGGRCGLGHFVGYRCAQQVDCSFLGFSRADDFKVEPNWWGVECCDQVQELMRLFLASMKGEDAEIIKKALGYYRASNALRKESGEMSLVASYAALETLVPAILGRKAGWKGTILAEQRPFHEKIRAVLHFCSVGDDPFQHLPKLRERAKSFNDADGFEMLSIFRNRVVHANEFKYSGLELYEAWSLSQWICEILMFYLIKYTGPMYDRRQYSGWRESANSVPIQI